MNKKGEFITLGIIIIVLTLSGLAITIKLDKDYTLPDYMGDKSLMKFYNLNSKNPNCNLNNVIINKENLIFFKSIDEAKSLGYEIDKDCN